MNVEGDRRCFVPCAGLKTHRLKIHAHQKMVHLFADDANAVHVAPDSPLLTDVSLRVRYFLRSSVVVISLLLIVQRRQQLMAHPKAVLLAIGVGRQACLPHPDLAHVLFVDRGPRLVQSPRIERAGIMHTREEDACTALTRRHFNAQSIEPRAPALLDIIQIDEDRRHALPARLSKLLVAQTRAARPVKVHRIELAALVPSDLRRLHV